MGVPTEIQDDGAEDALNFADRLVLVLRRLAERPMVYVVLAVVITLVLATTLYVVSLGLYKDDPTEGPSGKLVIDGLPTFEHGNDGTVRLSEGEPMLYPFDFYHCLELPEEFGEIVVCFIDHVSVVLTWTDEPDEQRGPVSWENQPDTVTASVFDMDGAAIVNVEGTDSNPHGGEGRIELEWRGEGEYLEESWRRVDEHNWEGVDGASYVSVRGGEVHWDMHLDGTLELTDAGDQTHDVLPVGYADNGNDVRIIVTLGGRCISLPPGSYDEPPE